MASSGEALRTATFTVLLLVAVAALWALRSVLILVGFAALLTFALEPVVNFLETRRIKGRAMSRRLAAALVIVVLVALGVLILVRVVPQVLAELAGFVQRAPENLDHLLETARGWATARGWGAYAGGMKSADAAAVMRSAGGSLLGGVATALGNLASLAGLALTPILAFYLLTEHDAVEHSLLGFVPEGLHPRIRQGLRAVDRALQSYVRGQMLVCATIGVAGMVAFWALGLPASLLLGLIVGFAEVVPILGFWVASIAIVLAGWSVSPATAAWAFLTYLVLNNLLGILVTPRVMGHHLRLHAFVVIVSILAGGALLGPAGAILALPLAAGLQSLIAEFAPRRKASG